LYPPKNRLSREEALRLYTEGSAWFSTENGKKGTIISGQYADFTVLPEDMMTIAADDIKNLSSILTVVGGEIVYADQEFIGFAPPALPISPSWSPVARYGGYYQGYPKAMAQACVCGSACGIHGHAHVKAYANRVPVADLKSFWGVLGCSCWA
jgi:hypothetical protein